jgi:hypothetical protein
MVYLIASQDMMMIVQFRLSALHHHLKRDNSPGVRAIVLIFINHTPFYNAILLRSSFRSIDCAGRSHCL